MRLFPLTTLVSTALAQSNWVVPNTNFDCWVSCNGRGGKCFSGACGNNGYCCSWKTQHNGHGANACPSQAVTALRQNWRGVVPSGAATCVRGDCISGYSWNGRNCGDINECTTGRHNCGANGTCQNTAGSYVCACKSGFKKSGNSCVDIDECADNSHTCYDDQDCSNTAGSFLCNCKPGFKKDGDACADIDECKDNNGNCRANSDCKNEAGTFTCPCKDGFTDEGGSCVQKDCGDNFKHGEEHRHCDTIKRCNNGNVVQDRKIYPNPCKAGSECTDTADGHECSEVPKVCKTLLGKISELKEGETRKYCDKECSCTDGLEMCVAKLYPTAAGPCEEGETCSNNDSGFDCKPAPENPSPGDNDDPKCPSDACWTLNKETNLCEMKDDEKCSKLTCDWGFMDIEVDSDVFGLEDDQKDAFSSIAKPTYSGKDGKWTLRCPLGSCGMTATTTVIDNVEYLAFSFAVSTSAGSRTIEGLEVFITSKLTATINYQCLYRSEVKLSSDEFSVVSTEVSDKQTNFGSLDQGFEINLFTDEDMTTSASNTNVFIGEPVYVSVDWKVNTLQNLAAFYVEECDLKFGSDSLKLVEKNCYASNLGAKIISEKVVSSSAQWQFKSLIVGRGNKTLDLTLACNVKVCTKDENKCERNISETDAQCPNNAAYGYIAN